jgi:hypothetical protein
VTVFAVSESLTRAEDFENDECDNGGGGGREVTTLLMECLKPFQSIDTVNEETIVLAYEILSSTALLSQATLKVL